MRQAISGRDWMFAKSGEGMTPIGPAIVPAAFVRDPGHLELSLTVNGETRQLFSASKVIVGVTRQIELLGGISRSVRAA
jgi:2-keto-4-pentenoate hydratase/2-oxohepta-3-ene-1,7-dioic acid hydratase in catechol pathway